MMESLRLAASSATVRSRITSSLETCIPKLQLLGQADELFEQISIRQRNTLKDSVTISYLDDTLS